MAKKTTQSFMTPKNLRVSEDTQVHMSTVYSRDTGGTKAKAKTKRTFSLVVKGILISSVLVGSLLGGGASAFASSADVVTAVPVKQEAVVNDAFRDEFAMISNLKMATKVLETAISRGELSVQIFDNLIKRLDAIEKKFDSDSSFLSTDSLKQVIDWTDAVLKKDIKIDVSTIASKRQESIDILQRVQGKMGTAAVLREGLEKQGYIINEVDQNTGYVKPKGNTVSILSASSYSQYTPVQVSIDTKLQSFSDPALLVEGSTMVPMRSIFETLGASVEWKEASQQVVAKKEDKTIFLTIGRSQATVRVVTSEGNQDRGVTLTQSPQLINSVTYVPLRFVSEALGAEVSWDANSQTAFIQSNPAATPVITVPSSSIPLGKQVIGGVQVRYGNHTYGSKSQEEYDKVMAIIDMASKKVSSVDLGEDFQIILDTYLDSYLESNLSSYEITSQARQNPASEYYQGMIVIDSTIGLLLQNDVPLDKAIELLKGAFVASSLVQEVPTSPTPSGARSAADTLLYNITDCDAMSNVYIAVFDSLGYNTAIVADSADAGAVVEINGVWYSIMGGGFNYYSKGKIELSKTLPTTTEKIYNGKGTYLHTPPTFSTQPSGTTKI
ncbi:hypothetical protein D3C71_1111140 [compost metagenome]